MGKIACVRQTNGILKLREIHTVEEITVGVCCCVRVGCANYTHLN